MAIVTLGAYTHYLWSYLASDTAAGAPGYPPDYRYQTPAVDEDLFNPRNYQDDLGQYHRVSVTPDHHLHYSRSDFATPAILSGGWNIDQDIPGIEDASFPVVTIEPVNRSVLIMWADTLAEDVLQALSNDDGETWEDATVAFTGGKYPAVWVGVDSSIMRGAYVSGNIKLTYQAPGDASPSSPFTMVDETGDPIDVKQDTFGLAQETNDATLRWTAELSVTGETATSTWESFDDGESWRRVT